MNLLSQSNLPARAPSPHHGPELSGPLFEQYRDIIYEKTGIYFQDNKKYLLESRIRRRLKSSGHPDYQSYLQHLQNEGMRSELPELLNAITINETSFFRIIPQVDVLQKHILPNIIAEREKTTRQVRIWSAGCSTGNEPYTIALIVKDHLIPCYPHIQFEIIGTDLNTEMLEIARAGVYSPHAVRNVPPAVLERYFIKRRDRFELKPEVRQMVRFFRQNLSDRVSMANMHHFDLVLCANVLIYFDTRSKQQVVMALYDSMNPGGYLLVGFSETLYGVTQAFTPVRFDKTIAYRKG